MVAGGLVDDGGGVPPAVQCETTNCGFGPEGVNDALAEFTLAPAALVMNHIEVLPLCVFSARFVTVVPSLNEADIVAPELVCVRLNCHVCVPPGGGGDPSNSPHVPFAFAICAARLQIAPEPRQFRAAVLETASHCA